MILAADARVHVVRDAARTYRDELRRLCGVELSEWDRRAARERRYN